MTRTKRIASIAVVAAATMLLGSSAWAALSKDEQKCLDCYNNKLRLVGQQAGKDYRSCIKNAGKGAEPNPDQCVENDTPGKISGKVAKVVECYTSLKCTGTEPIQQGAGTGSSAYIEASQEMVRDVFGEPISGVVSPGKAEAKCQDKAYQRAEQLFTEKLKAHRKCKKDGMKAGTVTNSADLELNCMTPSIPDPSGKIAGKAAKLTGDVNAACTGLPIATLFPGECSSSGTTAALGTCIETAVECRVCEALNAADGTNRNCDLFDDGVANGSCFAVTPHKCNLAPNPASQIQIHIAALPVPLTFGLSGSLDIGTGGDAATCDVQSLAPINIPAIGVVCISGTAGCALGTRYCGPGAPGSGPALGIAVTSDGMVGACTSNAACQTIANGACGGAANVLTAQCTGQCSGTTPQACTSDAQCLPSNGACNGPEPVGANANICQVTCINMAAHGGSDPGDLQCNLGSNLNVESAAPCDGTDVSIAIGQTCIPFTTERATGIIIDANFIAASVVPPPPNVNDQMGNPVACVTLDGSVTTGFAGVGAVSFFGSALGDLSVGLKATCQ